jgi:hypothetical protein
MRVRSAVVRYVVRDGARVLDVLGRDTDRKLHAVMVGRLFQRPARSTRKIRKDRATDGMATADSPPSPIPGPRRSAYPAQTPFDAARSLRLRPG